MENNTQSQVIIKVEIGYESGAGATGFNTIWQGPEAFCPWEELDSVAAAEGMVLRSMEIIEEPDLPEPYLKEVTLFEDGIRVTRHGKYIGTYMNYSDMTRDIPDIDSVGHQWL